MKLAFCKSNAPLAQISLASCLLAIASGCSGGSTMGADGSGEPSAGATELITNESSEALGESRQALTGPPHILFFIGDVPRFPTESTQPVASLSVVFATSVGLINNRVRGLNVCWYIPTNPDNSFTEGDTQDCTVIGANNASFGAFQTCPADMVANGYKAKINPDDPGVDSFGLSCVSLTDPDDLFDFGLEGSSRALFTTNQLCPGGRYLSTINMNENGLGMGGSCLAP